VATVELEHLTLYYGKVLAVDDLSLRIEDRELCVLLGPTGCGKTSTMRMIAGLEKPTAGRVILDGRVINDLYPGDRDVAMVFQDYALYPHMTVRQQFAFPLKAKRTPRDEIEHRVHDTTVFLQLGELLDRYPGELSVGQQQRVAIGRALIRKPKVFLMDEPLGQLDARMRTDMRANLKALQQELGITTVYVTHDQVEAQSLGDRIVVMKVGVIQQVGTPQAIYSRPANLFVASFIGTPSMNFVDCTLQAEGDRRCLSNQQFSLALSVDLAGRLEEIPDGAMVAVGIRPEHIRMVPEPAAGATPADVLVVEPTSNEFVVGLKMGQHLVKARRDRRKMDFKPQVGQRIWLQFPMDKIHLFDRGTEACLL
jgi:multiple sugar transport system ATP-binding protein